MTPNQKLKMRQQKDKSLQDYQRIRRIADAELEMVIDLVHKRFSKIVEIAWGEHEDRLTEIRRKFR